MAKFYDIQKNLSVFLIITFIFFNSLSLVLGYSEAKASKCTSKAMGPCHSRSKARKVNYIAIPTILVASMVGVSLPLFSKSFPAFRPDKDLFLLIRAFASGVIVATGFMHVMPDSWNDLTSVCLPEKPWRVYPLTPFITLISVYFTMMMDSFSIAYYERKEKSSNKQSKIDNNGEDIENTVEGEVNQNRVQGHFQCHNVKMIVDKENSTLLKDRVVAQVLELGIVVHSVVIGLAMGSSDNYCTIKPLIAAICFHQLFEGMGLGGCILQADYGVKIKSTMVFFFSVTTPFGIVLGILLQNVYKENSPTALITVGVLNAVSAGLLIYMALVDLLASDFKGAKLQGNLKLQDIKMMSSIEHRDVSRRRMDRDEDEDDEDEDNDMSAWERSYTDERSWESLQEDESGLLRPIDNKSLYHAQYRRRIRSISSTSTAARIQKGLIRYLYVVMDFSRAAGEMDFKPSRMAVVAKHVEAFVREFFDQNPLSQIGLVAIKDGVAHCLTDMGGSPESHIKALMKKLSCSGDASLQNALELVHEYLKQIPSYGHREVLILYSALSTCDPGDIMETIQKCKKSKIRCSIVGLSAEMFICKHICQETGGSYSIALDEFHLKELLLEHAPPPPAIAEYAIANLIKMGFPQRAAEGVVSICVCHKEAKIGAGYTCPRCKARVCELPTECRLCGLTLVSSPHLARSYHHLFPITPFDEVSFSNGNIIEQKSLETCFGCMQKLMNSGTGSGYCVTCPKCKKYFCLDCDIYIHDSLHNCPGCESLRHSNSVNAGEEMK